MKQLGTSLQQLVLLPDLAKLRQSQIIRMTTPGTRSFVPFSSTLPSLSLTGTGEGLADLLQILALERPHLARQEEERLRTMLSDEGLLR